MKNVFKALVLAALLVAFFQGTLWAQKTRGRNVLVSSVTPTATNPYIAQMNAIQNEAEGKLLQLDEGIKAAQAGNNRSLHDSLLIESDKILSLALDRFNILAPPPEMKRYHDLIKDTYIFRRLANKALLEGSTDSLKKFYRQGAQAHIDALTELKNAFTAQDAPRETLRNLEAKILGEQTALDNSER